MDGFLRAGDNDVYAIGYYVEEDRPFTSALARNYTTADRFFASILSETFPNRFFLHAAQTDRLGNSNEQSTLPTIWDRLAEAGVSGRYYYSDVPFLLLWGTKYDGISSPYAQFLADAAAGTLPAVSFVDPRFLVEELEPATATTLTATSGRATPSSPRRSTRSPPVPIGPEPSSS
jgi:phospholipase C